MVLRELRTYHKALTYSVLVSSSSDTQNNCDKITSCFGQKLEKSKQNWSYLGMRYFPGWHL